MLESGTGFQPVGFQDSEPGQVRHRLPDEVQVGLGLRRIRATPDRTRIKIGRCSRAPIHPVRLIPKAVLAGFLGRPEGQAGPRSASGRERYAKARHPKKSCRHASSFHESAHPRLVGALGSSGSCCEADHFAAVRRARSSSVRSWSVVPSYRKKRARFASMAAGMASKLCTRSAMRSARLR